MNRQNRLWQSSNLSTPLAGMLALALGGLLGLALLASQSAGLSGLGPESAFGQIGQLLTSLVGLGLLVIIALFDPLAAMLLWLLLAPYSPFIPLDISLGSGVPDLSLTRLLIVTLALVILAQAVRGQRRLRPLGGADLAYALFGVAMLLTAAQSRWGGSVALQAVFDAYLAPFVALYLARQLVRDRQDLRWVTATLLVIGVALAFLVIREQLTGQVLFHRGWARDAAYSPSIRKVLSLLGNAAPMGVTTAMTLPLGLLALVRAAQSAARGGGRFSTLALLLLALANGFIALGVFMTYNRASWLGVLLTVAILVALRPPARRVLLPVLLIAAILLVLFWPSIISSPAVTERLLEDNSINYRTTAASLAFDIARRYPLLGIGYGNFGFEASETYGWNPIPEYNAYAAAHNSYLFILVSGGLAALLPYLAWLALTAWTGIRRYRRLGGLATAAARRQRDVLAAGAALLAIYALASGAFDNAQTSVMNLVFFITLGAIWGATEAPPRPASQPGSQLAQRPQSAAGPAAASG